MISAVQIQWSMEIHVDDCFTMNVHEPGVDPEGERVEGSEKKKSHPKNKKQFKKQKPIKILIISMASCKRFYF